VGALQSNRVVVAAVKAADDVHKGAMEQAHTVLLDFIERMERAPTEVVAWARPQLENLNNSVLGVVPPNNFPQDHQRLTHQYRAVFQQRLDIMLRNVEIGHQKGAGFARAEKVESKEEWITAAEAAALLKPGFGTYEAQMTICARAHSGMIRARAQRFIMTTDRSKERIRDNFEIPKEFWWAEGYQALKQNWTAGDFETWTRDQETRLQAFGVSFLRGEIERLIPPATAKSAAAPTPSAAAGGRLAAEWWDDLWVEICRQLYTGELIPKKQTDIENAMKDWLATRGEHPADSTIRPRGRKLWQAIGKDKN
jgi:hypothetical protein